MPVGVAEYTSTGTQEFDVINDFVVFSDVVIAEEILEETSKGGIILPDVGDAQKLRFAKIIAQGPGRRMDDGELVEMWTEVGDVVMFGRYQSAGEPIKVSGKQYLMFRIGDFSGRKKRPGEVAVKLKAA